MRYAVLVDSYKKLEATTKRLEMIDILIELFQKTPPEEMRIVVYLTAGKIDADYKTIELGFADKMIIKALAKESGKAEIDIENLYRKQGDLGEVAELLIGKSGQQHLGRFLEGQKTDLQGSLTVKEVWETLYKISQEKGKGSTEKKNNLLLSLYAKASPLESKYITRTVLTQLRLGVKDLTIIEALSRLIKGGKEARVLIEHAYNVTSDLGEIGETLIKKGLDGVRKIDVTIGRPIRMMAAQRLASPEEILEKLGGKCALEYKYDGERVQAHIDGNSITLYSRNLNDISGMYPDVIKALEKSINVKNAIIEGEITAWDTDEEKMKTFQVLMSRKRKYDVNEMMEKIPIKVFLFDIIFKDGKSLLKASYPERRKALESIVKENNVIALASRDIVTKPEEFDIYFEKAFENGCEGIMAKDIRPDTPYQPGNRGFLWIKHKFDYTATFGDTFDLVVVGGFFGKGRRKGYLGALLMATYNPEEERYETITKLGTGFSDEDLAKITEQLMKIRLTEKSKDVFSKLTPDVWVYPEKVFEIQGADLSTSPIHTCGLNEIKKEAGIAIRFPRFMRYREDKKAEQATTTREIIEMYKGQRLLDKGKDKNETNNN